MNILEIVDIYFRREKSTSIAFIILSVVAGGCSALVWWHSYFLSVRGATVPLIIFGLLSGVVGGTIYFRTDAQVKALKQTYHDNAKKFAVDESSRMQKVNRNWTIYKWIEIAVMVFSVVGLLIVPLQHYWVGFSVAALSMAFALLVLDVIGEKNGKWYALNLHQFLQSLDKNDEN